MTSEILLAGFGGQGILFAGKVLAYCGLSAGREVSWLPSYGPEMRGGTCNCSVILSDDPIGSPTVYDPDILMAMNEPSFVKFIGSAKSGSKVFIDSTLVDSRTDRSDTEVFEIPATSLAEENGLKGGANIILLGLIIEKTGIISDKDVQAAFEKIVPPTKPQLIENNLRAISIGRNYGK